MTGAGGASLADELLPWFDVHGRHDLPWQRVRDPYRIWVSEIMLQQTQVTTVIPYFEKFVGRFPDVRSLAGAPLDDVLGHWSGLGYYARARNLHRAASIVVTDHGGEVPATHEALCALPGIGRSTAAAILALTWDEPHAILDGNVKRVLSRCFGVRGYSGTAAALAELWRLAEAQTPATRARDYTQAIMDLGATLCTRRKPDCERCPLAGRCVALAEGLVDLLPEPRPKKAKPAKAWTLLVLLRDDGHLLLERRPPTGIWGGLLSLPEVPAPESAAAWCRSELGIDAEETARLPVLRHGFTHFDVTLEPVLLRTSAADGGPSQAGGAGPAVAGAAATVLDSARWLWYNTARTLPGGIAAPIARVIRDLEDIDVRPQTLNRRSGGATL